jgi:hypothetical protein
MHGQILISHISAVQVASRRAGVDSITEGKKFPKASRKSCGRNLKSGSLTRKGIKTSHENTAPLQKRTPEPKLPGHRQKLKVEAEVGEKRKSWDFFHLLLAPLCFSGQTSIGGWPARRVSHIVYKRWTPIYNH